ncbi:MAG: hypothetical protein ACRDEA_03520 [Microcystaceae cyanobacterium]
MNSQTKTIGVFLALSLATSLVACGNNEAGDGDKTGEKVQPTEQPQAVPNKGNDEGGEGGEG